MQLSGSELELSASDLGQFLSCRHLTALNLAVALGQRAAPIWVDPALIVLEQRGLEHERGYAETLRAQGLPAVDLSSHSTVDAVVGTVDATRAGVEVIIQGVLRNGRWSGKPGVLRRREIPSVLGHWSYEVIDTKLAKETRGATILQLSLYSDLLGAMQKTLPELFHVVTPDPASSVQTFRVQDFASRPDVM